MTPTTKAGLWSVAFVVLLAATIYCVVVYHPIWLVLPLACAFALRQMTKET